MTFGLFFSFLVHFTRLKLPRQKCWQQLLPAALGCICSFGQNYNFFCISIKHVGTRESSELLQLLEIQNYRVSNICTQFLHSIATDIFKSIGVHSKYILGLNWINTSFNITFKWFSKLNMLIIPTNIIPSVKFMDNDNNHEPKP